MRKVCSLHQNDILSVCFHIGCSQPFLCRECFKPHPNDHNVRSEIKDIHKLLEDESWIESMENQRDTQVAQIESISEEKEKIFAENQRLLEEADNLLINSIKDRQSSWMNELEELVNCSDQQETQLEDYLEKLQGFSFRDESVFERATKVKEFNENVLPDITGHITKMKSTMKEWKLNQKYIEEYNKELIGMLQSIHLRDLLPSAPFRNLNVAEKLAAVEQEYTDCKRDNSIQIENLNQEIQKHHLEIAGMQTRIKEVVQEKTGLQNRVHTLNNEIDSLRTQVSTLTTTNGQLTQSVADLTTLTNDLKKKIIDPKKLQLNEASQLIQLEHLTKLEEWIPKPLLANHVFMLKLLYRGSRDGFSAQNFHSRCDNIAPTISIVKSKDYGRLFGGYTTKTWNAAVDNYVKDEDAFIFSLTHGEKHSCKNPAQAICTWVSYHLIFGGGHDFCLYDNCNTNTLSFSKFGHSYQSPHTSGTPESYSHLAGSYKFLVEEVEVYQIIRA